MHAVGSRQVIWGLEMAASARGVGVRVCAGVFGTGPLAAVRTAVVAQAPLEIARLAPLRRCAAAAAAALAVAAASAAMAAISALAASAATAAATAMAATAVSTCERPCNLHGQRYGMATAGRVRWARVCRDDRGLLYLQL